MVWRARAHREAAAMSGVSMDAARPSRSSFISTSVQRNSEESSDTCAAAQSRTHARADARRTWRSLVRSSSAGAPEHTAGGAHCWPNRPADTGRTPVPARKSRPSCTLRSVVCSARSVGLTSCTTKDTRCPRATSSAPSRASGSTRSRSGKLAIMTCRGATADELAAPSPGPGESSACASQRVQTSATASTRAGPISRM